MALKSCIEKQISGLAKFRQMADVEKAKVVAENAEKAERSKLGMEPKVQKKMELNALREQLSDQFFRDNPNSLTFFGVTMDPNDTPAIQIGVAPDADKDSIVIPEELKGVNVMITTIGRPTHGPGRPLKIVAET